MTYRHFLVLLGWAIVTVWAVAGCSGQAPDAPGCAPCRNDAQLDREQVADALSLSFRPKTGVVVARNEFEDELTVHWVSPQLDDDSPDVACAMWGEYRVESRDLVAGLTCATRKVRGFKRAVWLGDCEDGCHNNDRRTWAELSGELSLREDGVVLETIGQRVELDWLRQGCRGQSLRVKLYADDAQPAFKAPKPVRESLCQFADTVDTEISTSTEPGP